MLAKMDWHRNKCTVFESTWKEDKIVIRRDSGSVSWISEALIVSLTEEMPQVWPHANSSEDIAFELSDFPAVLQKSPTPNAMEL